MKPHANTETHRSRIAYRKGLLRLWVVLSGIWIVAMTVVFWGHFADLINRHYEPVVGVRSDYDFGSRTVDEIPEEAAVPFTQMDRIDIPPLAPRYAALRYQNADDHVFIHGWDMTTLVLPAWTSQKGRERIISVYRDQTWQRWKAPLSTYLPILLGPPIGILAIGLLVAWVVHGFRSAR